MIVFLEHTNDIDVTLYNGAELFQGGDKFSGKGSSTFVPRTLSPGTYYIWINSPGQRSTSRYVISALTDSGDDIESAAELSIPARVSDSIYIDGDVDWFRLTLAEPTYLNIWAERSAILDMRLLRSDGVDIGNAYGYVRSAHVEALLPADTYYIEVSGETGSYSLVVARSETAPRHLALGAQVADVISRFADRDYFRLQIATPSMVTVWSEGGTKVSGTLVDADGHVMEYRDGSVEDGNFRIGRLLGPGTYYVGIEGYRSGDPHIGPYVVAANAEPMEDAPLGTTLEGEIDPSGDADGYRLTVEVPSIVSVWAEGGVSTSGGLSASERLITSGRLLDEDGREIASAYESSGELPQFFPIERSLGPGTYYIEISSWVSGRTGQYVLASETAPVPDLPFGTRVDGELLPAGEHYRLTVDTLMYVNIWTEGDADTAGILYDEDGHLFAWVHGGGDGNNFRIERALRPGTYYLEVAEGSVGATGSYTLATASEPVPDLALGARLAGEIQPNGDADWYRIQVDSTRFVTVWTEGGTDTSGLLTDGDGHYQYSSSDGGDGENFRMERLLRAGTYYIVVTGHAGRATGDYTVAVEGEPALDAAFGARIDGEIGSLGERHRYRLVVEDWDVLAIWSEGPADPVVRVYDADGDLVAYDDDFGEANNFRIELTLAPGIYYVEVSGDGDNTGPYTLVSAITDPVPRLAFGERKPGELNPLGDTDHYRLTLDTPMLVTLWSESAIDTTGILYDEHGNTIAFNGIYHRAERGGDFRIEVLLDSGVYYLEVNGSVLNRTGDYVVAATAAPVPETTLGARVVGAIASADERDYYAFRLEAWEVVALWSEGGTDTAGALYDANGNGVAGDDDSGEADNFRIERALAPGTYFVRVRGAEGGTGQYVLRSNTGPVPRLAFGERIRGEVSPAGDWDHYRLTLEAPMNIAVWTERGADERELLDTKLYDEDGNWIDLARDRGGGERYRLERTLGPGAYYVGIHASHNMWTGDYELVAEAEPVPDTEILNLPLGRGGAGEIDSVGIDWFRLTVDALSAVTVRTLGGVDTVGRLYDEDWIQIASDADSGDSGNFLIERVLEPGTYFAEVRGHGIGAGYTVLAEARPVPDLALGTAARGRISPADDADWFRLQLSEPASVAIYTSGDLNTVGSLRDESDAEIGSDDDGGELFNFHIEGHRAAGVYYVRVQSYGSVHSFDEEETGAYTLHARRYVDVALPGTGGETVRLWATALGGWTRDPSTGEPFESGGEVAAANGELYVLRLGPDGVWRALSAAGWCDAGLAGTIRTLAGTGQQGRAGDGGPAAQASLNYSGDVAVDAAGYVYVADSENNRIRRIAPDGTIETIAGTGARGYGGDGGPAIEAVLRAPQAVAVDSSGHVYISDSFNHRVRRISPEGTIETIAGTGESTDAGDGGLATEAPVNGPRGLAVDAAGYLYVVTGNGIRRIGPDGIIETVAGTGRSGFAGDGGPATAAQFRRPRAVAVDASGYLYVADQENHRIRRIAPSGTVTTLAGTGEAGYGGDGGPAVEAQLNRPTGVAVDASGHVYVADLFNNRIRRIAPDGTISTIAGSGMQGYGGDGSAATLARLDRPAGVAVDAAGRVYIADTHNHRIRVVGPTDDHGDDAACATLLAPGVAAPGRIESGGDADWFRLELSEPVSLAIYTTGDLDTVGRLTDESGDLVASNDDGGDAQNLYIEGDRHAGVYFVRVNSNGSATGRYMLHVRRYVDVALPKDGGETVRLWTTPAGGWTLDRATGQPFASGGEVSASNGDPYVLTLGPDGEWTASPAFPGAGSCEADLEWTIELLAGAGTSGYGGDDGIAAEARFDSPLSVAVDASGHVYIADARNHRIRRISPDGMIETFAGTGEDGYSGDGGPAAEAQLNYPAGVAVDAAGYVYVADARNQRIRRIAPDGVIETFAGMGEAGYGGDGGPATAALFSYPVGVTVDAAGNVYVAEERNHRIRRIAPNGTIVTIAGTGDAGYSGDGGPATEARLQWPYGMAVDSAGYVYVADGLNHRIRRIAPDGTIETFAGTGEAGYGGDGGPATAAQLYWPIGLAVDAADNVYVADYVNHRIRRIAPDGTIETFAGTGEAGYSGEGGPARSAQLNGPVGVAVDGRGYVYVADADNQRIRVLEPPADDHGDAVACATPLALGAPLPGRIEAGDDTDYFRLELDEPTAAAIYTTGDLDTIGSLRDGSDRRIALNDDGGEAYNFYLEAVWPEGVHFIRVESYQDRTGQYTLHARRFADVNLADSGETVRLWGTSAGGWTLDPATDAPFATGGEVVGSTGARYVLTLRQDGTWTASAVAPDPPAVGSCEADLAGTIRTLAGTGASTFGGDGGPATAAHLSAPIGLAVDARGYVYVADKDNQRIRRIGPDGTIESIGGTGQPGGGGDGGPATEARLWNPWDVAVDATGNVYVADSGNHQVRRIGTDGSIETIAGIGLAGFGGDGGPATAARFHYPWGVAVDAVGYVYIADQSNHRIRRIAADGTIETFAGTGVAGFAGDGGPAGEAALNEPLGMSVDAAGNVYVADTKNHRIRRITPDGTIDTLAGTGVAGYAGDGGPAAAARLNNPWDVAVDAAGNVYVAERDNHRVRRIAADGIIQTLAGTGVEGFSGDGGPATEARLNSPSGLATDASGRIFVADRYNYRIRVVESQGDDHGDAPECATVLTLGVPAQGRIDPGDDQDWFRLQLSASASVAIYTTGDLDTVGSLHDESGDLIAGNDDIADDVLNFGFARDLSAGVYYVRVESYRSETGGYTLHAREFTDVALGNTGETIRLWVTDLADATGGWTLDPSTGDSFTSGSEVLAPTGARFVLTLGSNGVWTASPVVEMCEASLAGTIRTLGGTAGTSGFGGDGRFAVDARLDAPFDLAVDAAGYLFVGERGNHRIRRIGPDGIITTFAGTGVQGFGGDGGPATAAQFDRPIGLAVDASGNVYVADRLNHRVRRIGTDGTIETFAGTGTAGDSGDGGPATSAQLDEPTGVAVDAAGNVYVADSQNHRIRRIGLDGTIEAFAGRGSFGHAGDGGPATSARLTYPFDVAVDANGVVYVADTFNHRIRRIGTDGIIETIAGTGTEGYGGDGGEATAAHLNNPAGIAVNSAGYVFVADWGNHRIRRIAPDGTIETFAGTGVSGLGGDGEPAIATQLLSPSGVTVDAEGRVYIADQSSHRVRVVDLAEGCR